MVDQDYKYLLIGDGKVAHHFSYYFDQLGVPSDRWARRSHDEGDLAALASGATHALLLITDSAIERFILERPFLAEKTLVHFSGSLVTRAASGAHPLMTFTDKLYPTHQYRQIPFILDRGRRDFGQLLPGLLNPHWYISSDQRPLYHALCVASGNFTTILWDRFFKTLSEQLELPPDVALPYLDKITENLKDREVPPLTGPLARRDLGTIKRNLAALEGDPLQKVYHGFLEALNLETGDDSDEND